MPIIPIKDFHLGGISNGLYSGVRNSLYRMVGWDIHGIPGLLRVNQKMTKDSSSTVTQFCKVAVDGSNGIRYWFSSTSGKIWQDKAGSYTLVYTTVPETGDTGCLGAFEHEKYIYWCTQDRIHRIPIDNSRADGSSAWTTNAVPNWGWLNLISSYNTTAGDTYSIPTSFTEGDTTKKFTFTPTESILSSIGLNITDLGTGDWTVTLHDSGNNVIATKTIVSASMSRNIGDTYYNFEFSSPVYLDITAPYHIHIKVTAGTSSLAATTSEDLSTGSLSLWAEGDDTYHPMTEVNLVLYIGDRNFVHQVDTNVFTNKALDIPVGYRASALGKIGTDLLVGTIIATTISRCNIYRWDTYSGSFLNEDTVYEPGINAFLQADNYVIVNAGLSGSLYSYDGAKLKFYKRIPGSYSPTATAQIYPNAVGLFKGFLPLFGISNVSGDPCDEGVYSLGGYDSNYNVVLNLEFPTSNVDGNGYPQLTGIEIGAMIVSGNNVYMSWAYNSTYGIDKLDYSNKIAKPFLETRVILADPSKFTTYRGWNAGYKSMPSGCSVSFYYKKNHAVSYATDFTTINDTDRAKYYVEAGTLDARALQLRFEGVTSGNNGPEIEEIDIEVSYGE